MTEASNNLGLDIGDELSGGIEQSPVFTTQVDATGQVELTVQPSYAEEEDARLSAEDPITEEAPPVQLQPALFNEQPVQAQEEEGPGVPTEAAIVPPQQDIPAHSLPPTNHNMPADPAEMRRDFFKDVNKFGKSSGEGASALGRLGLRSLRAAADGILSTAKPQAGGKDDATLVYEAYAAMDSKHAEHTAGGAKANASKLRQIIGMGCMTTLSDPVAIGDRVVSLREKMEGADLKPKALFAALVDVAREQQGSDTELTDQAIEACLTKTKADKTLEKEWEAITKKVEALVTGEGSHGLKDQSETAIKISELCQERLKQYHRDSSRNELVETLMEKGYTRAMAEDIADKK